MDSHVHQAAHEHFAVKKCTCNRHVPISRIASQQFSPDKDSITVHLASHTSTKNITSKGRESVQETCVFELSRQCVALLATTVSKKLDTIEREDNAGVASTNNSSRQRL